MNALPTIDLTADRWLFQRLTRVLDRRVLSVLPGLEAQGTLATSINLNVSTIISPDFARFHTRLRDRTDKKIIIEVQPIDILADVDKFQSARDFASRRGYLLCLDGHSHITFPMLCRTKFGVAFQKVNWSPGLQHELEPELRERFRKAVHKIGRARVILCRCDDKQAVDFGRFMGVAMFQGRYIDRLLG